MNKSVLNTVMCNLDDVYNKAISITDKTVEAARVDFDKAKENLEITRENRAGLSQAYSIIKRALREHKDDEF